MRTEELKEDMGGGWVERGEERGEESSGHNKSRSRCIRLVD
jgi:hypothetical protein